MNFTEAADAQVAHFALHSNAPNTGYVGMAFPEKAGKMAPADSVIGYMLTNGAASVKPYHLKREGASEDDLDPTVHLNNTGAQLTATPTNSGLTICFTRTLAELGAAQVPIRLDGMPLTFAASNRSPAVVGFQEHNRDCDTRVSFLAVAAQTPQAKPGGNMGGDDDDDDDDDGHHGHKSAATRAHGALMIIVWTVLIPAGILAARHKALFNDTEATQRWFTAHTSIQLVSVLFFIVALYAGAFHSGMDSKNWRGLMRAHGGIGVTIVVFLVVQLVTSCLRPNPDHPARPVWNFGHHWTGRCAFILAFVQLMIGPKVYGSLGQFYAPTFIMLGLWAVVAVLLEVKKAHSEPTTTVEDRYFPSPSPGADGGTAPWPTAADTVHQPRQPHQKREGEGMQMQMLPVSVMRSDT